MIHLLAPFKRHFIPYRAPKQPQLGILLSQLAKSKKPLSGTCESPGERIAEETIKGRGDLSPAVLQPSVFWLIHRLLLTMTTYR
jgi:hypothetical protein